MKKCVSSHLKALVVYISKILFRWEECVILILKFDHITLQCNERLNILKHYIFKIYVYTLYFSKLKNFQHLI